MLLDQLRTFIGKKIPDTNLLLLEDLGVMQVGKKLKRFFKVQCDCGTVRDYRAAYLLGSKISRKTCGSKQCPYYKQRLAENNAIIVKNQHNKAILLESKEHNFYLIKCVYNAYKSDAQRRSLLWELEPQDIQALWIEQNGICKQTGIPLTCGTLRKTHTWSLDRIDNNKGYIKDNIQLVSKTYNMVKASHTDEEIKLIAYLLYQNMSAHEIRIYNGMNKEQIAQKLKNCTKIIRKPIP